MGWDEVPVLDLTIQCPSDSNTPTPGHTTRSFTATTNINATISAYLQKQGESSQFLRSITGQAIAVEVTINRGLGGNYLIIFIAEANGIQKSAQCSWVVKDSAPVITMTCPPAGTLASSYPTFCAAVDQYANISLFFDGRFQTSVYGTALCYTLPFMATAGEHVISVSTENINGLSQASCNWTAEEEEAYLQFVEHHPSFNTPIMLEENDGTYNISQDIWGAVNRPASVVPQFESTHVWAVKGSDPVTRVITLNTTTIDGNRAKATDNVTVGEECIVTVTMLASASGQTATTTWQLVFVKPIDGLHDSYVYVDSQGNVHIHIGADDLRLIQAIITLLGEAGSIRSEIVSVVANSLNALLDILSWATMGDGGINIVIPKTTVDVFNTGEGGGGISVNGEPHHLSI
ncbi:MAG: hypothetical protein LUQ50_09255 [Methanospirillum sp.]|uniref:hypothetical protein n=1 Tax=Methanospirillum sp. TaxID=45200 RepID=UPI00236A8807|nr:hypothetical protein [Methanospirillum sp.]MDD1729246.1 hypothetical protein [Methanospirillum sp.]